MSQLRANKKNILLIGLVAILSLPSIISLFHAGFFRTDDGNWMVIRLSAFYEALRGGEFPVRWLARLNNGYGYPVANFLYPGFLYIGIPLAIVTSSFVTTTKILFGLSFIFSAVGMYLWLRRKFTSSSSIVGSFVYLYAPYHLFDMTTRGSLGEVLALCLIPYVFWAIDKKSTLLTAFFLGFFLLSHNTLAILFLPLVIVYQISQVFPTWRLKDWMGIVLGIGLSSFFWIPALGDLSSTVFSQITISDWGAYFASMSLIGSVQLAILGSSLLLFLFFRKVAPLKTNLPALLFTIVGLLSLFLSTSLSRGVWEILPVAFIQFPFRFLSVTIFCAGVLTAWLLAPLKNNLAIGLGICILSLVTVVPYLTAHGYDTFAEGYYATNQATTTVKNEYMPRWAKQLPILQPQAKAQSSTATVSQLTSTDQRVTFRTSSTKDSTVMINQLYFPGWEVTIDHKRQPIRYTNSQGVIELDVPRGEHQVEARFSETPLRLFADFISLMSFLIILGNGVVLLRKNYEKAR